MNGILFTVAQCSVPLIGVIVAHAFSRVRGELEMVSNTRPPPPSNQAAQIKQYSDFSGSYSMPPVRPHNPCTVCGAPPDKAVMEGGAMRCYYCKATFL